MRFEIVAPRVYANAKGYAKCEATTEDGTACRRYARFPIAGRGYCRQHHRVVMRSREMKA